jgi:acylphosphatase
VADVERVVAVVSGWVQGVGFRYETRERARLLGLAGSARNLPDGQVEVVVEGPSTACAELVAWLRSPDAPGRVKEVNVRSEAPRGLTGFGVG